MLRSAALMVVVVACSSSEGKFTPNGGRGGSGGSALGCTKDTDCKGTRVCVDGVCTSPDGGMPAGGASGNGGASPSVGGSGAGGSAPGNGGAAMTGGAAGGGGASGNGGGAATGGTNANGGGTAGGGSGNGGALATGGTDAGYGACPLTILIMQDRSSSMVGLVGDPNGWNNSKAAVATFVNDPVSRGISVGLSVFPPMQFTDTNNEGDCAAGSDCGSYLVPIGKLPGNSSAVIAAYDTALPTTSTILVTPTECALRGLINDCLIFNASSGDQCVGILITDGAPTTCDTVAADLVAIAADGYSRGVTMYTLGLPGSDFNLLDQLATAGGTSKAIDVSASPTAFADALKTIRNTYCP